MKAIYIAARDPSGHQRLARRPIAEVMSKPVVTIAVHALLDDALVKMISTGLRHLAVVDEDRRCVGVLSDRTIASAWAADCTALARHTVVMALEAKPATMESHGAVVDAARLMRDAAVDAVAVVDAQGIPVGMVTGSDLVSLLAR
jgi:CBS domain-containing protein